MTQPGPQEEQDPAHVQDAQSDEDVLAPATPGAEALGDSGIHDDSERKDSE